MKTASAVMPGLDFALIHHRFDIGGNVVYAATRSRSRELMVLGVAQPAKNTIIKSKRNGAYPGCSVLARTSGNRAADLAILAMTASGSISVKALYLEFCSWNFIFYVHVKFSRRGQGQLSWFCKIQTLDFARCHTGLVAIFREKDRDPLRGGANSMPQPIGCVPNLNLVPNRNRRFGGLRLR